MDPHDGTGSEKNGMGRPATEGESPVFEAEGTSGYPEYRGTRGIPWEDGWTTIQA